MSDPTDPRDRFQAREGGLPGDGAPPDGLPADWDDADFDAWLARHLAEADASDGDGPMPDPARVAGHFTGFGDEALLAEAARRPELRRLLAEVAADAFSAEADVQTGAGAAMPSLSPAAHAAAVEAFEQVAPERAAARGALSGAPNGVSVEPSASWAAVGSQSGGSKNGVEPVALGGPHRSRFLRVLPRALSIAAAVLALAVPLGLLLSGGAAAAGPLLDLDGIERADGAGTVTVEGPRRMAVGTRIEATGEERVALRLADGARVVLGTGAEVRVVRAADGSPRADLALRRGAAIVATAVESSPPRGGGAPAGAHGAAGAPRLLLPDGGSLAVLSGSAHVAVTADGGTAVSLTDGASVLWFSARGPGAGRGGDGVRVDGPGAYRFGPDGLAVPPAGRAAAAPAEGLFRDLAFFGGAATAESSDRTMSARFWRIVRSPRGPGPQAPARTSESGGVPAVRFDLAPDAVGRVAWLPDGGALGADRLVLMLDVRPALVAPGGAPLPDVPLPTLVVSAGISAETGDGSVLAEARVEALPPEGGGPRRVELRLRDGWGAALSSTGGASSPDAGRSRGPARELVLSFRTENASAVAWFQGATFRFPADDPPSLPTPNR